MIQSEAKDPFGGNVYLVVTFFTRKVRNGQRSLHCDVVGEGGHVRTVKVKRAVAR